MSSIPIVNAQPDQEWLAEHREAIRAVVAGYGAAMVRGLELHDVRAAGAASKALLNEVMIERESFAPRTSYAYGVYSSTTWPPDQPMCMHHELSYALDYPSMIAFSCLTAPATGGFTALANGADVLKDLPAELVERFERTGWQFTRSHNDIVGVPWKEAFGADSRSDVEGYCRDNDIEWQWDSSGGLSTSRIRPAVITHPGTGQRTWFNQIAFLNEWTMEPAVREYLVMEFGQAGLPFNTRFGDGGELDKDTVDLINDVYAKHTVREPWQAGDLLLVDNIRMAHSREPYTGPRDVVVVLGDPVHSGGA